MPAGFLTAVTAYTVLVTVVDSDFKHEQALEILDVIAVPAAIIVKYFSGSKGVDETYQPRMTLGGPDRETQVHLYHACYFVVWGLD